MTKLNDKFDVPRPLFSGEGITNGLCIPNTATTFACRAECPADVHTFLKALPPESVLGFQVAFIPIKEEDGTLSVDAEVYLEIIINVLELWELRVVLKTKAADLHVMAETLQPVEKYTGKRTYDPAQDEADHKRFRADALPAKRGGLRLVDTE